jgi:hypothetical protein
MTEPLPLEDGAIYPELYQHAEIRIVHLLKQGVSEQNPQGYTSLTKMMRDGHEKDPDRLERMWKLCARRSYCILNGFPPWKDVKDLSIKDKLWPAFENNAVVNLIKKTGDIRTGDDALLEGAAKWSEKVRKQLEELAPQVVFCGGTFEALLKTQSINNEQVWISDSGMRYMHLHKTFYMGAYHPSHQANDAMEYTWFRVCAEEILGRVSHNSAVG